MTTTDRTEILAGLLALSEQEREDARKNLVPFKTTTDDAVRFSQEDALCSHLEIALNQSRAYDRVMQSKSH